MKNEENLKTESDEMNNSKEATELQNSEENGKNAHDNSFKRMFVIFKETWKRSFTLPWVLLFVGLSVLLPVLIPIISLRGINLGNMPLYSATMNVIFEMMFYIWFWSTGIVLTLMISNQSSGLIADEVDKGTMLMLVSKPVSRFQIFFGKFLAMVCYAPFINAISVFLSGWVITLVFGGSIHHYAEMLPLLRYLFAYCIFVSLIFIFISMALSSIMSKGRRAIIVMVFLIIVVFLVFLIVRLVAGSYYEQYYLYWIDLGYHLGNIFVFFIETNEIVPPTTAWQTLFMRIAGVYQGGTSDPAQNISLQGDLKLIAILFLFLLFFLSNIMKKCIILEVEYEYPCLY